MSEWPGEKSAYFQLPSNVVSFLPRLELWAVIIESFFTLCGIDWFAEQDYNRTELACLYATLQTK